MTLKFKILGLAAAMALMANAHAQPFVTPLTGNTSPAADWRFTPGQLFNGVAALDATAKLSFTATDGGFYGCSGSLLAGGQYVLTAGHCADGFTSMTVQFGYANGVAAETRTVAVSDATLHPLWQGFSNSADAGSDLALLKLSAPITSIQGYKLSSTNDVGKNFLIGGYGTTGLATSAGGTAWADGDYGHFGYNTADVDSKTFNKIANDTVPGWGYDAAYYVGTTYMADFDSGAADNNTLGRIAGVSGNQWASGTGLGAKEGLIAGGDSGGGDLVWTGSEWVLSAVHSWGWGGNGKGGACTLFGLTGCDSMTNNGSSYGDLSGSTAVFDQQAWINSVTSAVPEPQTYALMALGLLALGVAVRRRQV